MANLDVDMTGEETIPADSISSTTAGKRARELEFVAVSICPKTQLLKLSQSPHYHLHLDPSIFPRLLHNLLFLFIFLPFPKLSNADQASYLSSPLEYKLGNDGDFV